VEISITFPGGKKVNAEMNGMTIATDQPYALFLASIGTCAGIYVLSFCQERSIPADKVHIVQRLEYTALDEKKSRLSKITLEIHVPPDFPQKYHNALVKVADQCAVKKTIQDPPVFEVKTVVEG
jgi:ribosomal protein S12 methylthiotransferase accessory factor